MLDLNHPQTKWIFRVSHEKDAIHELTQMMTLLPTDQRQQLLERVLIHIERIRELNRCFFGGKSDNEGAIVELEKACRKLASLPSQKSFLDGNAECSVCGTMIEPPGAYNIVLCSPCWQGSLYALESVGSHFGTNVI